MNIRKRSWKTNGEKHTAWRLDYTRDGKRHQPQYATKREAELARDKIIRDYEECQYGVLKSDIKFRDFLNVYDGSRTWRTESYRQRTLSALRGVPFLDETIRGVTPALVSAYRDGRLHSGKAPATVRQDLAALSDALKWGVKLTYLRKNPVQGVEKPCLPVKQDDPQRYFSKEDFAKLVAKAGRDAPLYRFAAWTGLRVFELLALEWSDVHPDGYVVVRRGKGRKQRIVPLLPEAKRALDAARKLRKLGEKQERVFWWMYDRFCTLKRFKRRLGWANLASAYRFHDLRHTFGSWAASSGVDLEVIAKAMGHGSTTVTKLYAHLHPDYVRKQLSKMAGTHPVHVRGKVSKQSE